MQQTYFPETDMRTFTLRFPDDGKGEPKDIQFNSIDAHEAFWIIGREAEQRHVSLYEGERERWVITQTTKGSWLIETADRSARE